MGKSWKVGGTYTYNGRRVVVSAINDDGTITLNYAAGSGRTGFAGKLAGGRLPKVTGERFIADENDVVGDGVTLEVYNKSGEEDVYLVGDSWGNPIISREEFLARSKDGEFTLPISLTVEEVREGKGVDWLQDVFGRMIGGDLFNNKDVATFQRVGEDDGVVLFEVTYTRGAFS